MKAALAVLLFAVSAFAQDSSAIAAAEAACGPKSVNFDAKADLTHHPTPQPDAGTALVYVVEDLGQCPDCDIDVPHIGGPVDVAGAVLKIAMDGGWMGAGKGASYLFFPAAPGEHHLCINWQSSLEHRSRALAFANFTAETGQIYYFRARLFPGSADYSFDLDPINSDEGKFLVASSPFSVSHARK